MIMEFTKNNKLGYLQAAISFVIILLALFATYCHTHVYDARMQIHEDWKFPMVIVDVVSNKVIVAIFILLLVVNIFVQSKKSLSGLSLAVAIFGGITLLMLNSEFHTGYSYGFYMIMISILALFIIALFLVITAVVNAQKRVSVATPQPVAASCGYEKVDTAPVTSNSDIEELRARSAKLKAEREKIDAELEDELRKEELNALRAKTEKLEKELMAKELAELKAKLEKYEKASLQPSEDE